MVRKSYYLILGVSRNETTQGIREAFLDLAKRYRPDRLGPERLHFFQRILEAYHVLADPARRSQYDRGLEHAGAGAEISPAAISMGAEVDGSLPQAPAVLRALSIKDAEFEAALGSSERQSNRGRTAREGSPGAAHRAHYPIKR